MQKVLSIATENDVEAPSPSAGRTRGAISWHSGLPLVHDEDLSTLQSRLDRKWFELALKRGLDLSLAILLLLVLAPMLLFVAIAIRTTSTGPALITQIREGRDGQPFGIYKFRTMYLDRCDLSGVQQTVKDDPRITPLGHVLRKRNIDELPQLLNVLFGHMSLVGPRPQVYGQLAAGRPYRELVPYYGARHGVRPGLTGWAQANGLRGPTDDAWRARARIDHDLAYIANFSLALDIRILVLTVIREFRHTPGF